MSSERRQEKGTKATHLKEGDRTRLRKTGKTNEAGEMNETTRDPQDEQDRARPTRRTRPREISKLNGGNIVVSPERRQGKRTKATYLLELLDLHLGHCLLLLCGLDGRLHLCDGPLELCYLRADLKQGRGLFIRGRSEGQ